MINSLVEIISGMTAWAQSCPCHPKALRQQMEDVLGIPKLKCPMRGLRCPEIVAGELRAVLERHLAHQTCEVSLLFTAGLSEQEQSRARLDWTRLKGQLQMQLELKLMPFQSLPLSLLGLGHWDETKARELLWRACAEYESLTLQEQEAAHPLTKQFFSVSDGDLRSEVVQFLREVAAETLPGLMRVRLSSAWTPVLEQSIERKHAQLHARIKAAPHHSPPYVSLVERGPEVTELIHTEASAIDALTDICADVRKPALVAKALGLTAHPAFRAFLDRNPKQPLPHPLVASCVYRADPQTQYSPLDASAVKGMKPPPSISPFGDDYIPALTDAAAAAAAGASDLAIMAEAANADELAVGDVQGAWRHIISNMSFKHFAAAATAKDFFSVPAEMAASHGEPAQTLKLMPLEHITRPAARNFPQKMFREVLDKGVSECAALAIPAMPAEDTCMTLTFEPDSGLASEGAGEVTVADHQVRDI